MAARDRRLDDAMDAMAMFLRSKRSSSLADLQTAWAVFNQVPFYTLTAHEFLPVKRLRDQLGAQLESAWRAQERAAVAQHKAEALRLAREEAGRKRKEARQLEKLEQQGMSRPEARAAVTGLRQGTYGIV